MPELPEVETIVRGLRDLILGKEIIDLKIREERVIGFPGAKDFIKGVKGKKILNVKRRGKYIIIILEEKKEVVVHLRMTGQLLIKPRYLPFDKHTHVIFELNDNMDLRFNNVRKFGRLYFVDDGEWERVGGLAKLGPEPLSDDFTLDKFTKSIRKRKGNIKSLLLNQSFIAGMGNIYTDEALFLSRISPLRRADTLNEREIKELYQAIRKVLNMGIESGGTTFSDYLNANGEKGSFQDYLKVYNRKGENCLICNTPIIKAQIAGRSTHYCPNCQR